MATTPTLPWVLGAVLEVLRADSAFLSACHQQVDVEAPADVSARFAVVQLASMIPTDPGGIGWLPLVQVSGWSPRVDGRDVQGDVWMIATHAARVLAAVDAPRQWSRGGASIGFGFDLVSGPSQHPVDRSRGAANPLFGAYIRADMPLSLLPS